MTTKVEVKPGEFVNKKIARDLSRHSRQQLNSEFMEQWFPDIRDLTGDEEAKLRFYFLPRWESKNGQITDIALLKGSTRESTSRNANDPLKRQEQNTVIFGLDEDLTNLDWKNIGEDWLIQQIAESVQNKKPLSKTNVGLTH